MREISYFYSYSKRQRNAKTGDKMQGIVDRLLNSDEPSVRYKIRCRVLDEPEDSPEIMQLRQAIKDSPRVRTLLSGRDELGRIHPILNSYKKWIGAHWVFATLADIGYPRGDEELIPIRDQALDGWLDPWFFREKHLDAAPPRRVSDAVPVINGRARRCASQQSNALYSAVALGLVDDRCGQLADLLIRWQWPDGGWNCDTKPEAHTSSFIESLIPLRALSIYGKETGHTAALDAAERAAEVFLKRRLYRRANGNQVIRTAFTRLHYPCYWHYDILFALKVMAESGRISDPRCSEALDLLESKRLSDGGWPAEEKFYKMPGSSATNADRVSWGGVGKKIMNEWVTADALYVLRSARRF